MAQTHDANPTRPMAALTTIAMLKTYLDAGEDYLGMFRPFLAEVIADLHDPAFSAVDLQTGVLTAFGLAIPEPALRAMLGRLQQTGAIRREGGRYLRAAAFDRSEIREKRAEIEREHERLADAFVDFLLQKGLESRTKTEALDAIVQLLDYQRVEMLLDSIPTDREPPPSTTKDARLVALFLKEVALADATLASLVQRLLEGLVLESTLLLRDIDASKRDFRGLRVFLDTGFLLRTLGYCGSALKTLALETLRLLKETNARTEVFDVTLEEIRRILAVYRDHLLTPAGRQTLRPTELTRHFITSGSGSADLAEHIALLGANLAKLGIHAVQLPRRTREYQVDESRLQELLARPGSPHDEPRVLHDIDAVMGVTILRRGRAAANWEEAGAVFASLTGEVVRKIHQWHQESEERGLAPAVHLQRLSNIAWLKNPRVGSALKQSELIALCSAALRPSDDAWRRFLVHLRRLEESGNITSDEAAAVLASELTDRLLGEVELFEDVDAQTTAEVIERVKASYREEAAKEVDSARTEAEGLREEARQERTRRLELETRVQGKALVVGRRFSLVLCISLGVVVLLGVVTGLGYLPERPSLLVRVLIGGALGVATLLSALGMFFGTSLGNLHRVLTNWLVRKIQHWWMQ